MSGEATTLEKVVLYSTEALFNKLNVLTRDMGDRPFMGKKLTKQERLDEYKELRAQPFGLYNKMEGIRLQIEELLGGFSPEEREAEGISDEAVRKAAVSTVLKYMADMLKISEELNDPVVGSATVPPPPDPTMMIGADQWDSSKTSLAPSPDTPLPAIDPALPPPPAPSLPQEPIMIPPPDITTGAPV